MIGLPFNDLTCLGSVTEMVNALVENRDPVLVELAAKHATIDGLADWIRSLPQRDDEGDKHDGPKVEACEPPQRLRIPAPDPNCVERAAMYLGAAELIDPNAVRQLATLETPVGPHTFPLENGAPVILDPRIPRNCLDCGVMLAQPAPVAIDAHDAIDMTARFAEAGAAQLRNGPSRVYKARNAIYRLVDEGVAPADEATADLIGWFLALAESVARRYGARALAVVKHTALAIADLADDVNARHRNVAPWVAGMMLEASPWLSGLVKVAAKVGLDVGAIALRSKMQSLGITPEIVGLVEEELNTEGLTLGPLAKPARLATFATMAPKRAA